MTDLQRVDVAAEIQAAIKDVPGGTFLTLSQLHDRIGGKVSMSALCARLFLPQLAARLNGTDEDCQIYQVNH